MEQYMDSYWFVDEFRIDGYKPFYRYYSWDMHGDVDVYVNKQSQFKAGLKDIDSGGVLMLDWQAEEARTVDINEVVTLHSYGDEIKYRKRLQVNGFDLEKE